MNIPTFAAAMMTRGTLAAKKILDINAQLNEPSEHDITIKGNSSVIIHCLGESCDASKSPIQFGSFSNFVGHHSKKDENIIDTKMKKPVELMPKRRTALFQGGLCFKGERMMSPWLVKLVLLEILLQFQIWKLALNLELFYLMRNMAKIWRNLLALVYHQIYFLEELIVTRKRKKRRRENIFTLELCKWTLMIDILQM